MMDMTEIAGARGGRGGTPLDVRGDGLAAQYAIALLETVGIASRHARPAADQPPFDSRKDWARSGAMHLTGLADGPPLEAPGAVASGMRGAAFALGALSEAVGCRELGPLDSPALLGERAALASPPRTRQGPRSVGGSCRLLRCADAWIALNLPRDEDIALLPAWLEASIEDLPATGSDSGNGEARTHELLSRAVVGRPAAELIERARLLGLPAARLGEVAATPPAWCRIAAPGRARRPDRAREGGAPPLVVDLSSLWAGPLAGQLLAACGALVVKVESRERPDGARRGSTAFFDVMNGEKRSVAIEITSARGIRILRALLDRADIVIESSRPRALAQLGIDAAAVVATRPGVTWLSITGYGRAEPFANHAALGDDAAVAAGLVACAADGTPVFCGDAIADPLTGLHAAVAALASFHTGGGKLLDVPLVGVAARVARLAHDEDASVAENCVRVPRARAATRTAPPLGADTDAVLSEYRISC